MHAAASLCLCVHFASVHALSAARTCSRSYMLLGVRLVSRACFMSCRTSALAHPPVRSRSYSHVIAPPPFHCIRYSHPPSDFGARRAALMAVYSHLPPSHRCLLPVPGSASPHTCSAVHWRGRWHTSRCHSSSACWLCARTCVIIACHLRFASGFALLTCMRAAVVSQSVSSMPVRESVMSAHCATPMPASVRSNGTRRVAVPPNASSSHMRGPLCRQSRHVPDPSVPCASPPITFVRSPSPSHAVATPVIPARIFARSHASIGISSSRCGVRWCGAHSSGVAPLHPSLRHVLMMADRAALRWGSPSLPQRARSIWSMCAAAAIAYACVWPSPPASAGAYMWRLGAAGAANPRCRSANARAASIATQSVHRSAVPRPRYPMMPLSAALVTRLSWSLLSRGILPAMRTTCMHVFRTSSRVASLPCCHRGAISVPRYLYVLTSGAACVG